MMRNLLRRFRRRRIVLVDESELRRLREMAVIGATREIVDAWELRWLDLR